MDNWPLLPWKYDSAPENSHMVNGILALSSQAGHIVPQCLGNSNTHRDAFNMALNVALPQRESSVTRVASTSTIIHVFVIPLQQSRSAPTSFAKLERGKAECTLMTLSDHQFSPWAQRFILWSIKQLKTKSFVWHSLPKGTCSFRLNHIL